MSNSYNLNMNKHLTLPYVENNYTTTYFFSDIYSQVYKSFIGTFTQQ
jgi:hypothetical protein